MLVYKCYPWILFSRDEGVHWGIQNGLYLSRSTIVYFKHNDMESLRNTLLKITAENKRAKRLRRYIVFENVYQVYFVLSFYRTESMIWLLNVINLRRWDDCCNSIFFKKGGLGGGVWVRQRQRLKMHWGLEWGGREIKVANMIPQFFVEVCSWNVPSFLLCIHFFFVMICSFTYMKCFSMFFFCGRMDFLVFHMILLTWFLEFVM